MSDVATCLTLVCVMVSKVSVCVLSVYTLMLSGHSSTQDIGVNPNPVARIGGGTLALPEQFPYVVCIHTRYLNGHATCTGAIIAPRWVLSAAHCVSYRGELKQYDELLLMAGTIDFADNMSTFKQVRRAVDVIFHEDFYLKKLRNDVSLIKAIEPFVINEYVRPIALTDEPLTSTEKFRCTMVGFGATQYGDNSRLFYIHGTAIPCSQLYASLKSRSDSHQDVENVCVKVDKSDTSSCPGDSGGPLVCAGRLAGVLSGGVGHNLGTCGEDEDNFALYQSAYYFGPWVRNHTGLAGPREFRSLAHSDEKTRSAGGKSGINLTLLALTVLRCAHGEANTPSI